MIFIAILGLSAAGVLLFLWYYGGFCPLPVTIERAGGEILVYREISGPYRQSGAVMDRVYDVLLKDHGIETFKGFGLYYHNPRRVKEADLRCDAGCVLEEADRHRREELSRLFPVKEFPPAEYITAAFPYKGKVSVLFSLARVYPALEAYARRKGMDEDSPVLEIYDIPRRLLLYRKKIIPAGDGR